MKYKRVVLKLSGESLGGPDGQGLDAGVLSAFAQEICPVVKDGVQVAVVIGGGNIFRGLKGVGEGYDRVHGDQMGMLATVINSIALADALRDMNLQAEVYTATPMLAFANYYKRDAVLSHLEKGVVTLLAGGTGNPFFTTDSASALRAIELGADAVLKGTRVDGVYTADPEKDPQAVRYTALSYDEALQKNLKIMDLTAFTLCRENRMPIVVFNMNTHGNMLRVINGEPVGTIIK